MARNGSALLVLVWFVFLFCSFCSASVPGMINYQGKLATGSSGCLNDTVQIVFSIYPDSSSSTASWAETLSQVVVKEGVFSILLGSTKLIPDSIFDGSIKYLGVKVESDPEMTPRRPMVSVAYAYRAGTADAGGVNCGWIDQGAIVRLTDTTDRVGIGTTNAMEKLDVSGTVQVTGFKMPSGAANNYVLTSNASGVGTWQPPAAATDNDWTFRITDGSDTTITTGGNWGISRHDGFLYGSADSTHVNLGVACTTGSNVWTWKYCTVGGGYSNTAGNQLATVAGGQLNVASGAAATIGGGVSNIASGSYGATVAGGWSNTAGGDRATVAGGLSNTASGAKAVVAGGESNLANSSHSTVAGGLYDTASASYATVGGGGYNTASAPKATIAGGYYNFASGPVGSVGGGYWNIAGGSHATVAGGYHNTASGDSATVGGGRENTASGGSAVISGGTSNNASGQFASIGGGHTNTAWSWATVAGGYSNDASGQYATIAGGNDNLASGSSVAVGGGASNTASGSYAAVGGGRSNNANAPYATVPGGYADTVLGDYSMAAGKQVRLTSDADYTFAFGSDFASAASHSVIFYDASAEMRVGIQTTNPTSILTVKKDSNTDPVADDWTVYPPPPGSPSDAKQLTPDEYKSILQKMIAVPMVRFYSQGGNPKERIGIRAQEIPAELLTESQSNSISLNQYIALLHVALVAQQEQISALKARLDGMESKR